MFEISSGGHQYAISQSWIIKRAIKKIVASILTFLTLFRLRNEVCVSSELIVSSA